MTGFGNMLLAIVGPTASGKSSCAVDLALRFEGEVVSADSRQVYRGLDIGTAKITAKEMRGVPHHMIDVAEPAAPFSVAAYKKMAEKMIDDILVRGKLPILCGGTGFYIDAVTKNIVPPKVPPNQKLRAELEKESVETLAARLVELDPRRAQKVDPNNRRRIIRAIEIALSTGSVPPLSRKAPAYTTLTIGLTLPPEELRARIRARLARDLKRGMIDETRRILERVGPDRLNELGMEYRVIGMYLSGKLSKEELPARLEAAIWQYARRQLAWFRRDPDIKWFDPDDTDKIPRAVEDFLFRER